MMMDTSIRQHRPAFTLVELVIGLGAASLLVAGLASAIFFAGRSLDHGGAKAVQTKQATDVIDDAALDLAHSTSFTERTARAVTVNAPDRDGDETPDTIRFSWSGTAGDPLLMAFNGGAPATAAANVRAFNLTYLTRPVTGTGFVKGMMDDPALVAHWKFDETSGTTANDSTVNANHGTLYNGPTWTAGHSGNALQFDGSNDYVSVPHKSVLSLTSEMTITAWIYMIDRSGWRVIVNKGTSSTTCNYHFELGDGRLQIAFYRSGSWRSVTSPNTLSAGQWHHVAVTMEVDGTGRRFRLYENGVQATSQKPSANPTANLQALQIGRWCSSGEYFSGRLDDVRIYSRKLSADEILQVKNGIL